MQISRYKKSFLITAVLYILFGLLLCVWPQQIREFIYVLFGAFLLIFGVFRILRFFKDQGGVNFFQFDLVMGLTALVFGLFLFFRPQFPDSFLPFALGIGIMLNGFVKLQYAFSMKKHHSPNWKWLFISSIVFILLGLMLVLFPIQLNNLLTILIGVTFILAGISDIVSYFQVKAFYKTLSDIIHK